MSETVVVAEKNKILLRSVSKPQKNRKLLRHLRTFGEYDHMFLEQYEICCERIYEKSVEENTYQTRKIRHSKLTAILPSYNFYDIFSPHLLFDSGVLN